MSGKFPDIERSGRFMVYFQASGLCDALRASLVTDDKPGKSTFEFIQKLREDAQLVGSGHAFERLPTITDSSTTADLLVAAEVIRTTMLAFLSPEEIANSERSFSLLNSLAEPVGNLLGSTIRKVIE